MFYWVNMLKIDKAYSKFLHDVLEAQTGHRTLQGASWTVFQGKNPHI